MGLWGGYGFKSGTLVALELYVYREWWVKARGVWESWLWRVYPLALEGYLCSRSCLGEFRAGLVTIAVQIYGVNCFPGGFEDHHEV